MAGTAEARPTVRSSEATLTFLSCEKITCGLEQRVGTAEQWGCYCWGAVRYLGLIATREKWEQDQVSKLDLMLEAMMK